MPSRLSMAKNTKRVASEFNRIVGQLIKRASVRGAAQNVIRDTFARAGVLAKQVRDGEITMRRAVADITSGAVVKVGQESLRALPEFLAGRSHTALGSGLPIQKPRVVPRLGGKGRRHFQQEAPPWVS